MRFPRVLLCAIVMFLASTAVNGQSLKSPESPIVLHTATGDIFGTLLIPNRFTSKKVALIIAGSGPTDRDGNNSAMKNNSLKYLAIGLADNGIASVRFDKRGIAASKAAAKTEASLNFESFINDVRDWTALLRKDKRFSKITVIGHSEGSLIGMAGGRSADKFVSIAGPGQPTAEILKRQLGAQPTFVQDIAFPIIDSLQAGHLVKNVNPMLSSLFRPSVQPYLISLFKYDPQLEIAKLKIPVLITQGTNDIQVTTDDAQRLAAAQKNARLVLITNMNHILKVVEGDRLKNMASYNNPDLPVSSELIETISKFILQ